MAKTRAATQPAGASAWSMAWRMLKATEAALNSTTSAHGYQVGRLARLAATTVRVATTMKPSSTPGQMRASPGRTPLARAREWRAS
jgi:hypothetical protein